MAKGCGERKFGDVLSNEALLREGKMNIDREGKVDSLRLRV